MDIKELRELTGMSQKRFAEYFGIPIRTIQEWEQNKRKPAEYLTKLMEKEIRREILKKEKQKNECKLSSKGI